MGVILRQGLKNSAVKYVSIVIGALGAMFIYPLDWELYGNIQYWLAFATLLTPFLRLGSTALINKFHPYFKQNNIKGLFGLILLITICSIILMSIVLFIINSVLITYDISIFKGSNTELILVYILTIMIIFNSMFFLQSSNAKRIVVPEILKNLFQKIFLISIIFLSFKNLIPRENIPFYIVIFFLVINLIMIYYLSFLKTLDINKEVFKKLDNNIKKLIFSYWIFGGLNYLGTILAYKIDTIMIGNMLTKTDVGFYSTFLFLSVFIEIPFKSVSAISSPIISKAITDKNISLVSDIYKKATNNLFLVAVFIFSLILMSLDSILEIMTNGEALQQYKFIFLILGIAKIIDSLTSVNNLIIIFSKWYKTNLFFLLILSILNILLNFIFINKFGLIGAAYATSISILLFNIVKLFYIFWKMKIHPFSKTNIFPLIIVIMIVASYSYLPIILNPFISIFVYSICFTTVYLALIYKLKISNEFSELLKKRLRLF